jgi:hypothetical protein
VLLKLAPHREVLLVFSPDFTLPSGIILRVSSMFALGIIFSYTRLPLFSSSETYRSEKRFQEIFLLSVILLFFARERKSEKLWKKPKPRLTALFQRFD